MDTLAHALWSYIIFHNSELVLFAVIFGILPDLLSWAVFMFYPKKKGFDWKNPDFSLVPKWVFTLYGLTHSIFTIAAAFFIVFLFFKKIPVFLFAWPIHVLMDIPTHTKDFLPTPFLWPFSSYKFPGIRWGTKPFMITNYSLIFLFLILIDTNNLDAILDNFKRIFRR